MEVVGITFRPLTDDDLPLLHRWLNDPGVVRWWEGDDVSWDGVVAHYGSGRPADSTELWLGLQDGGPIGWIQCYPAADEPEETAPWTALGAHETAAGIDYLLGEPGARGKGLGSSMIRAFVKQVVFGQHPEWTQACAGPFTANEASWRALAKAGFRKLGTIEDEDGECTLMAIDRTDI